MKVAIIGAGMAGLSVATRLHEAGARCTVFEKSRGLGGRMATRRAGALRFDHGAQYFTARGESFRSRLLAWQGRGAVAEWLPGKWVGTPGMTAPARSLAEGLQVVREYPVTGLAGGPGRWRLVSPAAPASPSDQQTFDTVIMAIPAPQAAPLAASAGIRFAALERVRYAPCLTLMLAFDRPTEIGEPVLSPADGPIAWIARNNTKPGRAAALETLVVHAAPEWSRAHLDDDPDRTAAALFQVARPWIGAADPTVRIAHRWRYARVEQVAGMPFAWDPARRVGACGDWGGGARVEAAFDSGEALAAALG